MHVDARRGRRLVSSDAHHPSECGKPAKTIRLRPDARPGEPAHHSVCGKHGSFSQSVGSIYVAALLVIARGKGPCGGRGDGVSRVLHVDDHGVVRLGVRAILADAEDVELVATASGALEAIALAREHEPDVVLMDLSLPGLDGVAATREILRTSPSTRIVALTEHCDREHVLDALDAGAIGYLLKDAEPAELVSAVRVAAEGGSPLAPRAASVVLRERAERKPADELTGREQEVFELVREGLPNKLIARRLEISEKTVKTNLSRIFRKLGVFDRTQAALWGERHHLRPRP
jgi:DNA-binding NarL/FixJ family response regulator